ncbi:MAG: carbohydrate kinase [Propionibacteriales bacterium]|nr:carbohydrate kinase [Propionibacteriales bacterium]
MSVVLGVDLATASARVVAVDLAGAVLTETAVPLPPVRHSAGGRAEQDADYAAVVHVAIGATAHRLGARADDVVALSITGTSGTVVPCDSNGAPVSAALMYDDRRAATLAEQLSDVVGHLPQHRLLSAPTSALARIGWLQQQAPAPLYLSTPDVVLADLAGHVVAADTSHALKSGADLATVDWPEDVLAALGVPTSALPTLVPPGTVVGEVDATIATALGLPPRVRLVSGMTDGCTAQIAAGAVTPGTSVGVLGTTLVLKGVTPQLVTGFDGAVYSHRSPSGDYWPGGASNVGAGGLSHWFADTDLAAADAAAAARGPSTLLWYPLVAEGERFPFVAPDARGFTSGDAVDAVDRYRAHLEGVALVERLGVERLAAAGVASHEHHAVGGGSRSETWLRIRATALGRPVRRAAQASSGFGAAVLAASPSYGGLSEATHAMVRDDLTVDPVAAEVARMDDRYAELTEALVARGWLTREPTPLAEKTL